MRIILFSIFLLLGTYAHAYIEDYGKEKIVNYGKHGTLENIGTDNYRYIIKDFKGLGNALGEGIYPNQSSIYKNKKYIKYRDSGVLAGNRWNFVNIDNHALSFFKWGTSVEESLGVRQFYVGQALEKEGLIEHAIKAYYSVVMMFPKTVGRTYWHNPWYVGSVALDKVKFLCREYKEFGYELDGAFVKVKNKFDNIITNDYFEINPGKFIKSKKRKEKDISKLKIKEEHTFGKIKLVKYKNGHFALFVRDEQYIIKGVSYIPASIGYSPGTENWVDWFKADFNKNGLIDGPYDAWVDENNNGKKDKTEKVIGDFGLMEDMGVNTLRLYHHASNKELLRDLYDRFGIMVMIGDYLGMFAEGSKADWYKGTDYTNKEHQENMLKSVEEMVMRHKDEDYVLMWILGNENIYGKVGQENFDVGEACKASDQPREYFKFVNKVARRIKEIDPNHPVAICNGDLIYLDIFKEECKDVDIFGCNAYRGDWGFGDSFWEDILNTIDKPVLLTEYGCPAFYFGKDKKKAESYQKNYHKYAWEDIIRNSAGALGTGISLGGVVFEWIDEWWKAGFPFYHDKTGQWAGPFPDGWMHEEWLGICSYGKTKKDPYIRYLRDVYFYYRDVWNE